MVDLDTIEALASINVVSDVSHSLYLIIFWFSLYLFHYFSHKFSSLFSNSTIPSCVRAECKCILLAALRVQLQSQCAVCSSFLSLSISPDFSFIISRYSHFHLSISLIISFSSLSFPNSSPIFFDLIFVNNLIEHCTNLDESSRSHHH